MVDAPLSRTPTDAWAGTLDVMVGGDAAAVARARPVLEAFAGRIVETGPVGTGHAMKLLNNFVAMGYAALYSEALMIGAKAGLSAKVFDAVIRGGRMDCLFYQTFFKYVLERDRDAHRFTHRQRAEGRHLSGELRPGARRRQPGRRGGAQQLRPGGRRRRGPSLCADAVRFRRALERRADRGLDGAAAAGR